MEGLASTPADTTSPHESEAWRALYHAHFDEVHRVVCFLGAPLGEAEDLAQIVFLRVRAHIGHLGEVQSVRGWLRGIALRVVAEHRRWRKVRQVKEWVVKLAFEGPGAPAAEECVATTEEQRAVHEVLCRMSPKLREALVLCDIEEMPVEEVATIIGAPANTVRSRRRLAREQFRGLWERRQAADARRERQAR